MFKFRWLMLAVLGLCGTGLAHAAEPATPAYRLLDTIAVGGEGGWDYLNLDPVERRLYISRANRVIVMDVDQGKVVGEVADTPGIHGIALAPKVGRGYTSNGRDASVTVFDLKTLKQVARVKVGQRPDAILYDPATERVFTMNAGGGDATAIDTETNKVAGTVKLGGRPEFAVSDEKGQVFVNLEDKSEVLAIDARELTVKSRWKLAPGKEPSGLAIDRKNRRLFSTCHNEMMVVLDADSGKVIATPKIGRGTDAAVFDPEAGLAFSSNGDGTLTMVRDDGKGGYEVAANVQTKPGARTMALDPKTHKIYLATAKAKPGQRRAFEPGSFVILVVGPDAGARATP